MDRTEDTGALTGSRAGTEPQSPLSLGPSGFDPERITLEHEIRRRAIEEVIGWIEQTSFREVAGIWAKRKRDREDAELRGKTIREERASLISVIRARLGNESGTMLRALREIQEGTFAHARGLTHWQLLEAQILAERGLVALSCTMNWARGFGNGLNADAEWRAEITDKGRAAIAMEARQGGDANAAPSEGRQRGPKASPKTNDPRQNDGDGE